MIKHLIQELSGVRNQDTVTLLQCTVNSVDMAKRICNVTTITGDSTITFDAKLTAGVSDGIVIEPEKDSVIFVIYSKYTLPFVILYSDIVSYFIKGGEFGGLVKVIELTEKLRAIETKLNEVINTFNLHSHSSTGSPPTPLIVGTLTLTEQEEIENTAVKHGNS